MLRVHRHDLPGPRRLLDQVTARNQGLLVRQGQHVPGSERRQRRRQADGPGDAIQHDVGVRPGGDPRRGVGAGKELRRVAGYSGVRRCRLDGRRQVIHRSGGGTDGLRPGVDGLPGCQFQVAAGGERRDLEAFRGRVHHIDALRADRPSGAQQHHLATGGMRGGVGRIAELHAVNYPAPVRLRTSSAVGTGDRPVPRPPPGERPPERRDRRFAPSPPRSEITRSHRDHPCRDRRFAPRPPVPRPAGRTETAPCRNQQVAPRPRRAETTRWLRDHRVQGVRSKLSPAVVAR